MQYEGLYFKIVPKHFIFFSEDALLDRVQQHFCLPLAIVHTLRHRMMQGAYGGESRCSPGRHPTLEGDGRSRAQEKEVAAAMAL
jgi:dihydroorotase